MLASATPLHVLVVEDEELMAEHLEATLQVLGYITLGPAADAATALALCEAAPCWPDVALLDINLAGPTNGIALAQQLRARHPLPLIFLTTRTDADTFALARAVGPAAYLVKPAAPDALQRAIELAVSNFATTQAAETGGEAADDEAPAEFGPEATGVLLPDALFVKEEGLLVKVRLGDITSIEAHGKHCRLTLPGRVVEVRQPLHELARRLPGTAFVQIHRSYFVNASRIERLDTVNNLVQVGEQVLPLSLTFREELLRRLQLV